MVKKKTKKNQYMPIRVPGRTEGRSDGRTKRQLYALPSGSIKTFGEHKKLRRFSNKEELQQ